MTLDSAPRWRRLEPDERRAQILACARRLFGERHYEAVSTTELARESGVARGLINHYFGTKRELYLEVVRELMFVPEFAVEKLAHGTLEQRVGASIDRFLSSSSATRPCGWPRSAPAATAGTRTSNRSCRRPTRSRRSA